MKQTDCLPKCVYRAHAAALCAIALTFLAPATARTAELFDWTGFYIGGTVGCTWNNYDLGGYRTRLDLDQQFFDFDGGPLKPPSTELRGSALFPQIEGGQQPTFFISSFSPGFNEDEGTGNSIIAGGQVGYQRQFGHIVVGIEGSFEGLSSSSDWATHKDFQTNEFFFDGVSADTTIKTMRKGETNWQGSLRLKTGYATGPFLFYVTGGIIWADLMVTAEDRAKTDFFFEGKRPSPQGEGGFLIGTAVTNFLGTDEGIHTGWTVGTGIDYAFTPIASVGIEFRHNDFGSRNYHFSSPRGPLFPGDTSLDSDSNQLVLKVNFLLGHMGH